MHRRKEASEISKEVLLAEYEALYHYALSLCKNEAEAQDLTQETFLKAMNNAHKFKGNSSLYTWLCAIAKNQWLNGCKKKKRELPPENIPQDQPDESLPVEQYAADRDTALHIHEILHELNEPYKEVFSLRVFGQLPFADIARLFSKTESWARVTYYRARKMISEKMQQEGYYE